VIRATLIAYMQPDDPRLTPEGLIEHCARVSSPKSQSEALEGGKEFGRLLRYLVRNAHWSPLEMASAVVEVECPRDIARQLLRHRSFSFQEFSQRYAVALEMIERMVRRQDQKNRQNSTDDLPWLTRKLWAMALWVLTRYVALVYSMALRFDVAKETARVILPEGLTMSRLYVNGTLRSWLHYLNVREGNGTQAEHVELARAIREALSHHYPNVMKIEL
jgi:thymidylate synthase (FAD)